MSELTWVAVAVNVFDVLPAATVTDDGVLRLALLSDSAMTAPPAGAACDSVTVQVLDPGVAIDDGEQVRFDNDVDGTREIVAVRDVPLATAVTIAEEEVVMAPAFAAKFAVVAPAATVVEEGTARSGEFDDRLTVKPPAGAALLSVKVHVDVPLELTVDGAQDRFEGVAGACRASVTLRVTPL
ncbi:MAG: hypothetical protein IPM24_22100 [Bryobacterales bacterium]|nr:hypothetical protein [Bryobacterales bacterium]